jgi:hypothetical protein
MKNTRWKIHCPIRGEAQIIPQSIRYYRDKWHPYGWEVGFTASTVTPDGIRARRYFGALGTDRHTAMVNSLPRR